MSMIMAATHDGGYGQNHNTTGTPCSVSPLECSMRFSGGRMYRSARYLTGLEPRNRGGKSPTPSRRCTGASKKDADQTSSVSVRVISKHE